MKQNFEEAAEKYAAECYPHNVAFQTTVKGFFLAGIEHATKWIRFEDQKPEIGQEIWVVWPSGNYPPELRRWNEKSALDDWSHMRWLPVPSYAPSPPSTTTV
jgi:hypothetical protein